MVYAKGIRRHGLCLESNCSRNVVSTVGHRLIVVVTSYVYAISRHGTCIEA
jgi:hypothetical protein